MKKMLAVSVLAVLAAFAFAACSDINVKFDTVYTVTFDENGGTAPAAPRTRTVKPPEDTVELPTTNPKLDDHVFVEWNTAKDGEGDEFTAATKVTGNITVYAKWGEIETTGTPGLGYDLITPANTAYRVRKGTVTSGVVRIPSHRRNDVGEYLPVTQVGNPAATLDGNGAFQGTTITEVIFLAPSNITTIGSRAFQGITTLTSITLPDSVTSIEDNAFYDCTGLTSITVDAENLNFASQNGILYNKAMTTLIQVPGGITGPFTIPAGVTIIGDMAFWGCTGLTSITIPAGVTSIGSSAFRNCTGLTSMTIPAGVTDIGGNAFNGCTGLTSITVLATTPPTLGSSVFSSIPDTLRISVPAGSVAAYKAAGVWLGRLGSIHAVGCERTTTCNPGTSGHCQ